MSSDLRTFVARELRLHPRVAYQGLLAEPDVAAQLAADLPRLTPFRTDYVGAVAVLDWDHRLPSKMLWLRVFAYYTEAAYAAGQEAFDDRLEEIGARDKYPEFDVPDFDHLMADEAYEIEVSPAGEIGRCRLTSAWRREISREEAAAAVGITRSSPEFCELLASTHGRPPHLGDLEAVSWTPPCESDLPSWTIDVWYLLAFDGRMGTGRSFLVEPESKAVATVRDFSVRTG